MLLLRDFRVIFFGLLLLVGLTACQKGEYQRTFGGILGFEDDRPNALLSADELQNRALKAEQDRRLTDAARYYDDIERYHPYSAYAKAGQIKAAELYYKQSMYDDTINTLNRFIELNPSYPDIDYAYHIRAQAHFDQINIVERDQAKTLEAKKALQELARRFPQSKYGLEANIKLDLINEQLAGHEMEVGRYYQRKKQHLAALRRFKAVTEDYEETALVEEALHRMVEVYLVLGLDQEAQRSADILGTNYPSSPWYVRSYVLLGKHGLVGQQGERNVGSVARLWA